MAVTLWHLESVLHFQTQCLTSLCPSPHPQVPTLRHFSTRHEPLSLRVRLSHNWGTSLTGPVSVINKEKSILKGSKVIFVYEFLERPWAKFYPNCFSKILPMRNHTFNVLVCMWKFRMSLFLLNNLHLSWTQVFLIYYFQSLLNSFFLLIFCSQEKHIRKY